jgi:signal transduction histidine kinase
MAYGFNDEPGELPLWRQRIDRALPVVLGTSIVLSIFALLFYASMAARDQNRALIQQQRSYEIVALARRLDSTVAKAESDLSRYVISADKNIGRQYQDKWGNAYKELQALKRATRSDPVQTLLISRLENAYRERGEILNDIALRVTYKQNSTALGIFYQASRAESLTRITGLLEHVIDTENARLKERNLDVKRAGVSVQQITTTYRLVGLVLLVGLLILGWFARYIMRERRVEQRLTDDEYYRTLQLEAAVTQRTEELQIAYENLKHETAERTRVEDSLRQMQKMEAVGQLTGGIAHDFNNMLTVVVGGLELARRRVEGLRDVERHIDNAMEGANRASALTRRLLAFARSEPLMLDALSPDDLITGMRDLLDRTIGDQITVERRLDCNDWKLYTDRHQFENAILNLAVNARDAMDGCGRLVISSSQVRLRADEIGECVAGEYIMLSVADDGCGMTPEVLERVFEPFFTTKDIGKGTGLGLSQVFGFARQSGGDIRIISAPGEGTDVRIYLPRHHAARLALVSDGDPASDQGDGSVASEASLTILLVEDDPRVLAQTRSALSELGHRTICCDHPHKALGILRESGTIDLILSDVLMPDQTGPEMVAALPAAYRTIPVLFVTGYAGEVKDNSMFEGHSLLRKPYTISALQKMINQSISQRPSSPASAAAG